MPKYKWQKFRKYKRKIRSLVPEAQCTVTQIAKGIEHNLWSSFNIGERITAERVNSSMHNYLHNLMETGVLRNYDFDEVQDYQRMDEGINFSIQLPEQLSFQYINLILNINRQETM